MDKYVIDTGKVSKTIAIIKAALHYAGGKSNDVLNLIRIILDLKVGIYDVKITKYRRNKTDAQRGYYFGVCIEKVILQHEDFRYVTKEEVMEANLYMFAKRVLTLSNGTTLEYIQRISAMNELEMSQLISETIDYYTSEWGMEFPEPEKGLKGILKPNQSAHKARQTKGKNEERKM